MRPCLNIPGLLLISLSFHSKPANTSAEKFQKIFIAKTFLALHVCDAKEEKIIFRFIENVKDKINVTRCSWSWCSCHVSGELFALKATPNSAHIARGKVHGKWIFLSITSEGSRTITFVCEWNEENSPLEGELEVERIFTRQRRREFFQKQKSILEIFTRERVVDANGFGMRRR